MSYSPPTRPLAIAAAALVLAAPAPAHVWDNPAASQPAERLSRIAGHPVRCYTPDGWRLVQADMEATGRSHHELTGYAKPGDHIGLPRLVCSPLKRLLNGWRPSGETAATTVTDALVTFGHEVAHMRGIMDEQDAEAYGFSHARAYARAFGLDTDLLGYVFAP